MIEADNYSYRTMDSMIAFDKTFRRSKPMQKLAGKVKRLALREKLEEEEEQSGPLTETQKKRLAIERHFIKRIKKGLYP